MKKLSLLILSFVLLISCAACSPDEQTDEIEKDQGNKAEIKSVPRSTDYKVEIKTLSDSVKAEDGTELVSVSAQYPVITNPENLENVDEINKMYADNAQAYVDAVKADFDKKVTEAYANDPESFEKYTFEASCIVTYNKNCFLSIKRDYEERFDDFVGKETYADVFDMSVGLPLYADEIITGSNEDIMSIIFLGFSAVADQYPNRFVDGYVDILNSAISGTEFYLTDSSMVFVLQPGIATYPEYGCLTFEFPYEGNEAYFLKLYEK